MRVQHFVKRSQRSAKAVGVAVLIAGGVVATAAPASAQEAIEPVPVPLPTNLSAQFAAADVTGGTSAWAVGSIWAAPGRLSPNRPLAMRWSNGQWTETTVPDVSTEGSGEKALSVATAGPRDAWMSGEDTGGLVIRRWNGSAWNRVPFGLTDDDGRLEGNAVAAAGGRAWVTVTGTFGGQLQSRVAAWTGRGWTYLPNVDGVAWFLNEIEAAGRDAVWVAGNSNGRRASLHQWNGSRWIDRLPDRSDLQITDLKVVSRTNVWVMAQSRVPAPGEYGTPVLLHWNGRSWTERTVPDLTGTGPLSVASGNEVWMVGQRPEGPAGQTAYVRFTRSGFESVPGPDRGSAPQSVVIRELLTLPGTAVPFGVGQQTTSPYTTAAVAELRRP